MSEHFDPSDPGAAVMAFLTERHLATLTTRSPSDALQVAPVGFTYDPTTRLARVITWASAVKARNVEARPDAEVALCQVDGGRWLALHGRAVVRSDAESTAEGERRYEQRYRPPKSRPDRVVVEIMVERMLGRVPEPSS